MCENAGTIDCQISKSIQLSGDALPKPPQKGSTRDARCSAPTSVILLRP